MRYSNGAGVELLAESPTEFFYRTGEQFAFTIGEDGQATGFLHGFVGPFQVAFERVRSAEQ
jgi:hypothetical protein